MDIVANAPFVPASQAGDAHEGLDRLLEQVIDGLFVLTDGQGALSKWSEQAEMLFDLPAEQVIGEPLFGRVVDTAGLSALADGWRAFLEHGESPGSRGRVEVAAHRPGGGTFPLEAVFVPVKLDEGFDFSLFLEDLSFELPLDMMILRMRQQHPVVVRALRAALADDPQPWDGWRTAGTLVAFRPLAPTPWMDEAVRRRAEEAAAAEEELRSRIHAYDAPEVEGDDVYDLEDARAVIDRLRWATERIEELEERSRRLEVAAQQAADARPAGEMAELLDRVTALTARFEAAEAAEGMLRREQDDLRTGLEDARREGQEDRLRLQALVEEIGGMARGARDDASGGRAQAAEARADAEATRRELEAVRAELATLREQPAETDPQVGELREALQAALATLNDHRQGFEEARQAAVAARRDAEAARTAAEHVGAKTSENFAAVWREMLAAPRASAAPAGRSGIRPAHRATAPEHPGPPERPQRPGFDDQARPMAVLDLEGRFTELNPAFSKLVGYGEREFRKASWPSALDRGAYKQQLAGRADLLAGAADILAVESTYMHGQGLMVPVTGELSVLRDDSGAATGLLLTAGTVG